MFNIKPQQGVALLLVGLLSSCGGNTPPVVKRETVVFGTTAAIDIVGLPEKKAVAAIDKVFAMLGDMHSRFYPWRDGELRRLNTQLAAQQLPMKISDSMQEMLTAAKKYSAASHGLFNPAIGRLTELWGFHLPNPPAKPPPTNALQAWRDNPPQMTDLQLNGNTVSAAPEMMQLDFGALAKGVALDRARQILSDNGVRNALINIGGSVLAMGKNGERTWLVALFADRSRPPIGVVELQNGEAVSTSGGSERFFVYQGKTYHHILDPRSGEPAQTKRTAIVISDDATAPGAISDALATALVIADDATADSIAAAFGVTMHWRLQSTNAAATSAKNAPSPAFAARLSPANNASGKK